MLTTNSRDKTENPKGCNYLFGPILSDHFKNIAIHIFKNSQNIIT